MMRVVLADYALLLQMMTSILANRQPAEYRVLSGECFDGRVMAALDEAGTAIAAGGLLAPDNGGPLYAWFSADAGRLRRRMPALMIVMRRVLRAVSERQAVAVYVQECNPIGARMALALGFEPGGLVFGDVRQWNLTRAAHGQDLRQAAKAAGGAGE